MRGKFGRFGSHSRHPTLSTMKSCLRQFLSWCTLLGLDQGCRSPRVPPQRQGPVAGDPGGGRVSLSALASRQSYSGMALGWGTPGHGMAQRVRALRVIAFKSLRTALLKVLRPWLRGPWTRSAVGCCGGLRRCGRASRAALRRRGSSWPARPAPCAAARA